MGPNVDTPFVKNPYRGATAAEKSTILKMIMKG